MKKKGFYFFVLMSIFQLYSMESYDISPSMIIDNPCGLLEQAVIAVVEYAPKLIAIEEKHALRNENNVQAWLKEMKDLHKEYTQRCPLHLVLMTEDYYCGPGIREFLIKEYPLSRKYYPKIRNAYEEKISKLLLEALNRNRSDFGGAVLTHFGSELFSVLRTITKVLKEKPDACLAINLIDSEFICDGIANYFYKQRGEKLEEQKTLKGYVALCKKQRSSFIGIHNEDDLRYIIRSLRVVKKQFIAWTKKHFPLSKCSLALYGSVGQYLDDMKEVADVVSAVNLNASVSKWNTLIDETSLCDYILLGIKTLLAYPLLRNCSLECKDYSRYEVKEIKPTFFEFTLNKPDDEREYKECKMAHLPPFYMVKEVVKG